MYNLDITTFSQMCKKATGRCPHSIGSVNNACGNDDKQMTCYNKRQDRRQWGRIRKVIFTRDGYKCRLLKVLTPEEKEQVTLSGLDKKIDPAHVFGRGSHPHLKYDVDNVVSLSRGFHNRLDQYKNPVTGESISLGETYEWWKRIVGDGWEELQKKASKKA